MSEAVRSPDKEAVRKDAELVVDVCMSVEADDVVTIITDDEHDDQAHVVAEVCVDRGAWPVIMNNETQVRRGRADTHFPMAPPRNLHEAMVSSDEIIIITDLEWANRFAHVPAVKQSCENNAKIASVEPGMGSWGLTVEELKRAQQRAWDAWRRSRVSTRSESPRPRARTSRSPSRTGPRSRSPRSKGAAR